MTDRPSSALHAVTGAFGFSGRAIARRLLESGLRVRTLTNARNRPNPFGGAIEVCPLRFDDPARLAAVLEGVEVLYNTYWVRTGRPPHAGFAEAVENSRRLFEAARAAGVRRIVHLSVTNPDPQSRLGYFRGKAEVEAALRAAGVSWTILRPALIFDREEILINNIVWLLRRLPVFGIFGDGRCRVQPIWREDLADLAVRVAAEPGARLIDAIGPETFTYRDLVEILARALGRRPPVLSIPPWAALLFGRLLDLWSGDVLITREEIEGLMQDRLCTDSPPAATTRFSEWVRENIRHLGRRYANDLARRRDG